MPTYFPPTLYVYYMVHLLVVIKTALYCSKETISSPTDDILYYNTERPFPVSCRAPNKGHPKMYHSIIPRSGQYLWQSQALKRYSFWITFESCLALFSELRD
jgi:hypothetical protein